MDFNKKNIKTPKKPKTKDGPFSSKLKIAKIKPILISVSEK